MNNFNICCGFSWGCAATSRGGASRTLRVVPMLSCEQHSNGLHTLALLIARQYKPQFCFERLVEPALGRLGIDSGDVGARARFVGDSLKCDLLGAASDAGYLAAYANQTSGTESSASASARKREWQIVLRLRYFSGTSCMMTG
jgi:hypothetical protein